MSSKKLTGHVAMFGANLIFGINNPVSRSLMPGVLSPYTLTYFRLAGGVLLFWGASLFFKHEKVPPKDLFLLFLASLFAITINQLFFFVGLSMSSSINASIVVTMLPIVTMLLAAFILGEPVTLLKVVGVLVGASGALLIVFDKHSGTNAANSFWGNLIVFVAVMSFALYLTLFRKLINRYSPITIMKWMFLFAAVVSLPFCYSSIVATDFASLSSSVYLRIIYVVVFASFLGYLALPVGQKVLRPTTLSMYNYVQPVMASLVAVFAGLDIFGYEQALAGVLVFAGVYIVTQSKSKAQVEADKSGVVLSEDEIGN